LKRSPTPRYPIRIETQTEPENFDGSPDVTDPQVSDSD